MGVTKNAAVPREKRMIRDIATKIDDLAQSHRIGQLQSIRKRIKGLDRRPGSSIFADSTISDDGEWAFHFGGRKIKKNKTDEKFS